MSGTGRFVRKIPGGKLLKLDAEYALGRLARVSIRGDFFAHPEEAFDRVEAALQGIDPVDFPRLLREAVAREGVIIYGVGVDDIVDAFERASDAIQVP
ncbi:MAG: hypothetical protein JXA15_01610 [Spirochaetales bacterium]|nr:hypothetical protein [Spirochaetales bacterium]